MHRIGVILLISLVVSLDAHIQRNDLSKEAHFSNHGKHNAKFDHEAFLGKELAAELEFHTFDENKKKLVEIIAKIDKDNSGGISQPELYDWIKKVAEKSLNADTRGRWEEVNPDKVEKMSWEKFLATAYGPLEEAKKRPAYETHIKPHMELERNRWKHADVDGDGNLDIEEFKAFVHPEDYRHMKELVVDETLAIIDKDKDGFVSTEEYLRDFAETSSKEYDPKSDWVLMEAANFDRYRDKDHNGKLDRSEIAEWIMPKDYDPIDSEMKHLFYHSDKNKDEILSAKEILETQDIFVGSQATNYGKHLKEDVDTLDKDEL